MTRAALRHSNLWLAVSLSLAFAAPASGGEPTHPSERGTSIAEQAYRRTRGFGDLRVGMTMTLRDRRGKQTHRKLTVHELEGAKIDRSLVVFDSPRDIRGTALLTWSYKDRDDEQWLYLPALKRSKRISSANRSSPFMGSEFSYEDLASYHVQDFDYRFVRDDTRNGTNFFVIERRPRTAGSAYLRQQVWVDKGEYRVVRIVYFDKRGRRLKTLSLGSFRAYLKGSHWRPHRARMVNEQTGDVTDLTWSTYRFRTGLRESDFSQSALKRER